MAEIKISDLSIGDWVRVDDFDKVLIKRVSAIDGTRNQIGIIKNNRGGIYWYCNDEIEPIPLTPEILEKNGLEYEDDGNDAVIFLCCDMFWARLCVGDTFWQVGIHNEDRLDAVVCDVKHTHQLQHALRLAGIEKEIEV